MDPVTPLPLESANVVAELDSFICQSASIVGSAAPTSPPLDTTTNAVAIATNNVTTRNAFMISHLVRGA